MGVVAMRRRRGRGSRFHAGDLEGGAGAGAVGHFEVVLQVRDQVLRDVAGADDEHAQLVACRAWCAFASMASKRLPKLCATRRPGWN